MALNQFFDQFPRIIKGLKRRESTLKILRYVRKSHPEIVIMCSGGISSSEQARILLNEGANALQIYTSLVYKGPGIIKELNNGLLNN